MHGMRFDWEWDPGASEQLRRRITDRRSRVGQMMAFAAQPVESFINWYGLQVAREAARRAPRDTGAMSRSVNFAWEAAGGGIVYSTTTYGGYVDQGTKPHWPPVRALEGWAQRHGIPAFLVARAIAEKGTPKTEWLSGAFEVVQQRDLAPGLRRLGPDLSHAFGSF